MATKNWEEGQSGNPDGRPAGKPSKPISSLRRTLTKLRGMEKRALENIEAVVNGKKVVTEDGSGEDISKLQLETSKWVISQISALSRSATQEEALKLQVRREEEPAKKEEEKATGTDGKKVVPIRSGLSLDILPDGDDEDEEES